MVQQDNLQLMKTLDDAWNSQDWETFKKRHAENTAVFWPHWKNGEIIEEKLFYDLVGLMKQIGLG